MNVNDLIILEEALLKDVMHSLERASLKVCVVTSAAGKIIRTITDGDIRRALLGGFSLENPVSALKGNPPVTCLQGTSQQHLLDAMDTHQVSYIILVDQQDKPVGIVDRLSLTRMLYLSPPHIGDKETEYVALAFDENFIAPAGTNLIEFERVLAVASGKKYALALSSGTAAIHLALCVLDIAPHDRVYVADTTFIASVNPILYERATPVLIDCEPLSWNMSPQALRRALENDAKKGTLPGAIIVVHLYGQSADMQAIMALANHYDVPVIEDAAESLGAEYQGKPSGYHGLISVYSFNGNKIITTSGGGALVSDREDLINRAKKLSTQGRDSAEHYQHSQMAYNYRLSNVLAGIGRGQMEILSERVTARRRIFRRYTKKLGNIAGLSFQQEHDNSRGNRWLTVMSLDVDIIALHPYRFLQRMREQGLESRPAWKPMHLQPLFLDAEFWPHRPEKAVGGGVFLSSLCLPSGSSMTDDDQDKVITTITNLIVGGI